MNVSRIGFEFSQAGHRQVALGAVALLLISLSTSLWLPDLWLRSFIRSLLVGVLVLVGLIGVGAGRVAGGWISPFSVFLLLASGYATSALFLLSGRQARTFQFALSDNNLASFDEALLCVTVGIAVFMVTYLLTAAAGSPGASEEPGRSRPARLMLGVAVLTAIGLIGWGLFVTSSGGLSHLIANIHLRSLLRSTDYFRALTQFAQVAHWGWVAVDPKAIRRPGFWMLTLVLGVVLLTLGSRLNLILHICFFFVLVVIRDYDRRRNVTFSRRRVFQFALAGLLTLAITFGMLAWRKNVEAILTATPDSSSVIEAVSPDRITQQLSNNLSREEFLVTLFGQSNLPSMEIMATIVMVTPEPLNFLYGRSFLWVLTTPIPRYFWPEKPVDLGLYLNRAVVGPRTLTGRPPSWIGELYLNFALPGVLIGCAVFGAAGGLIQRKYHSRPGTLFGWLAYSTYVLFFVALLMKGQLASAVNRTAFYVVGFAIFAALVKGRAAFCPSEPEPAETSPAADGAV